MKPTTGMTTRAALLLRSAAVITIGFSVCATPAFAQSTNVPVTRGYGGGHGGGGKGIIGTLIGIGVGMAAGAAVAHASQQPTREEPQERPKKRPAKVIVEREAPAHPKPPREKVAKLTKPTEPKPSGPKTVKAKPAPVVAKADPTFVPDEVIFETKAAMSDADLKALAKKYKLEKISSDTFALTGSTIYHWRIKNGRSVDSVVAALSADDRVSAAQPNHIYKLSETSGTEGAQYAIARMRLTEAHSFATGQGVAVAIIDSGADKTHPALKDAIAETYDPVGAPFAAHPHGTGVAGLVAGRGELASPAPAAKIFAVRAFGPAKPAKPGAEGTTMHILRGLDWAAAKGVKVINMSFAGPQDAKISQFIAAGVAKGEIHVASAGNAGPSSPPLYPAADPNVIAVTATDADGKVLEVANRGDYVSIAAPGVDVLVAAPGGGLGYLTGTSMSSAEVAGVVALLAQGHPNLTTEEARAALMRTAIDRGAPGIDPDYGAGEIDAKAAVDAIASPPVAKIDTPPAATSLAVTPASVQTPEPAATRP